MDQGAPGDLLAWSVRYQVGWPRQVTVELTLRYTPTLPVAEINVEAGGEAVRTRKNLTALSCRPDYNENGVGGRFVP